MLILYYYKIHKTRKINFNLKNRQQARGMNAPVTVGNFRYANLDAELPFSSVLDIYDNLACYH